MEGAAALNVLCRSVLNPPPSEVRATAPSTTWPAPTFGSWSACPVNGEELVR